MLRLTARQELYVTGGKYKYSFVRFYKFKDNSALVYLDIDPLGPEGMDATCNAKIVQISLKHLSVMVPVLCDAKDINFIPENPYIESRSSKRTKG